MPQFETFNKNAVPLKHEPQLTVQRRGVISLNRSAYAALGSPKAIELLFDKTARIIGLRDIDPRAEHAYPVRSPAGSASGPFTISAMAYTKFYDIDTTVSRRWTAYLDDGVLCVNLNDPGTPVTSNRAGSARELDGSQD